VVAPGIPAGHVVRFGGKTVYFAGDTCLFLDMQLIAEEELDVAVLPIGDRFTMGPKDAVKAAKMLRAGTVIPCHYNTFPAIEQDPQAFKRDVEAATASSVVVLAPGQTEEF
jgi:L-ascorbate metabolism protein UlaG (beta-lactamase superfamily)